jgi:hypothetical protein
MALCMTVFFAMYCSADQEVTAPQPLDMAMGSAGHGSNTHLLRDSNQAVSVAISVVCAVVMAPHSVASSPSTVCPWPHVLVSTLHMSMAPWWWGIMPRTKSSFASQVNLMDMPLCIAMFSSSNTFDDQELRSPQPIAMPDMPEDPVHLASSEWPRLVSHVCIVAISVVWLGTTPLVHIAASVVSTVCPCSATFIRTPHIATAPWWWAIMPRTKSAQNTTERRRQRMDQATRGSQCARRTAKSNTNRCWGRRCT